MPLIKKYYYSLLAIPLRVTVVAHAQCHVIYHREKGSTFLTSPNTLTPICRFTLQRATTKIKPCYNKLAIIHAQYIT